jgi:hypothetical protein
MSPGQIGKAAYTPARADVFAPHCHFHEGETDGVDFEGRAEGFEAD